MDDFVHKCVAFMQRGPTPADERVVPPYSRAYARTRRQQRRKRGRGAAAASDSDSEPEADEGDALDWAWLGVRACYPYNIRPPVPGFMLGPLSRQKKRRQVTQRTARVRRDLEEADRPDDVRERDVARLENSNTNQLCTDVYKLLEKMQVEGEQQVEQEYEETGEDLSEAEYQALMARHGVRDTSGVCLFEFAFNPRSFGQTIENLFYLSFLIRDGVVGIQMDSRGLPTLGESLQLPSTQLEGCCRLRRRCVASANLSSPCGSSERSGPRGRSVPGDLPHRPQDMARNSRGVRYQGKHYPAPSGDESNGWSQGMVWLRGNQKTRMRSLYSLCTS